MLTARDIDDGMSVDYFDTQLSEEEAVAYMKQQQEYERIDRAQKAARLGKRAQYFPHTCEVGYTGCDL